MFHARTGAEALLELRSRLLLESGGEIDRSKQKHARAITLYRAPGRLSKAHRLPSMTSPHGVIEMRRERDEALAKLAGRG